MNRRVGGVSHTAGGGSHSGTRRHGVRRACVQALQLSFVSLHAFGGMLRKTPPGFRRIKMASVIAASWKYIPPEARMI